MKPARSGRQNPGSKAPGSNREGRRRVRVRLGCQDFRKSCVALCAATSSRPLLKSMRKVSARNVEAIFEVASTASISTPELSLNAPRRSQTGSRQRIRETTASFLKRARRWNAKLHLPLAPQVPGQPRVRVPPRPRATPLTTCFASYTKSFGYSAGHCHSSPTCTKVIVDRYYTASALAVCGTGPDKALIE